MGKDREREFIRETTPVVVREVKSVLVSDGVYKYVYVDTGEDVKTDSE